jgi:Uma2 family endonuclease
MQNNKEYLTITDDEGNEQLVEEPQSSIGFTYTDYLQWKFKERIELIMGKIFKMCPAPSLSHQRISSRIEKNLGDFLKNSPCSLFHAPVDVRLKGRPFRNKQLRDDEIFTVVQPDVIVVCDEAKLKDNRFVDGAPDFIAEILSPGNTRTETRYKLNLYEENGVKEYWVVYPDYRHVMVFLLNENDKYGKPVIYEADDTIESAVLNGFSITIEDIFGRQQVNSQ